MFKIISKVILLFFILSTSVNLHAQEICDNAIDDDADGMIDLNDSDCICMSFIESSLIPNPSFEEMLCCPTANEMLNCAENWIQASAPTTDYVHTCGNYLGNTSIPAFAPLPFADGEGAVGFRDGQQFAGGNYKEYVGACLTEPMVVGVEYRLDFFVGFRDNVAGSGSFNIAFFGSSNCNNLPFGGNNSNIGCPLNAGGYAQLAQQEVSGNNEWVNVVVEFVADQPYEVLVLGPSCNVNPNFTLSPYFYVDRLAFEEVGEFGTPLESVTGAICEGDLVLSVADNPANDYQWYQDGVALVGETGNSLAVFPTDGSEGTYLVSISTDDGCSISQQYIVRIPPYYAPLDTVICEEEFLMVGNNMVEEAGYYEYTILAVDGCDSIVQLDLSVASNSSSVVEDIFCEGEVYSYYDLNATEAGNYEVTITNSNGCDSIVELLLTRIDQGVGVELPDEVTIPLGESVNITPDNYNLNFISFQWYNEANELLSENLVLENYQSFENTTLYLEAADDLGCMIVDSISVEVDRSNLRLYIPNVFTPDDNGINDFFRYFPSAALESVKTFAVFDRWGGNVYTIEDVPAGQEPKGWDGRFKGKDAGMGVYAYFIHAVFLDGTETIFEGDVVLIR